MTTHTSYTAADGTVHIARNLLTDLVVTACKLSLPLADGEVAIPGYHITCGKCWRSS